MDSVFDWIEGRYRNFFTKMSSTASTFRWIELREIVSINDSVNPNPNEAKNTDVFVRAKIHLWSKLKMVKISPASLPAPAPGHEFCIW